MWQGIHHRERFIKRTFFTIAFACALYISRVASVDAIYMIQGGLSEMSQPRTIHAVSTYQRHPITQTDNKSIEHHFYITNMLKKSFFFAKGTHVKEESK